MNDFRDMEFEFFMKGCEIVTFLHSCGNADRFQWVKGAQKGYELCKKVRKKIQRLL